MVRVKRILATVLVGFVLGLMVGVPLASFVTITQIMPGRPCDNRNFITISRKVVAQLWRSPCAQSP
jgi:hypothetical protein